MSSSVEGNSLWFMGGHVGIKLAQAANADGITLVEHTLPPGFAPPLHVHHHEEETFYILEGEFRFRLGDGTRQLGPGEALYLPAGVPHGFRVLSLAGGRCLTITRGGFETMLRQASVPAAAVTLPDPAEPTPEALAHLAALCAANGIDLIGPPID